MVEFKQSPFIFFIFLLVPSFSYGAGAQSPTQPIPSFTPQNQNWDPSMAIIAGCLVFVFLVLTIITIFFRQCLQPIVFERQPSDDAAAPRDWACSCSQGIEKEVIDTFPILVYSSIKDLKIGKGALECAVCLSEFDDMDTLRLLPKCNHVFHPECIDAWLLSHITCPVCRANLKPASGEIQISMPTQLNDVLALENGSSGAEIRETEQQTELSNVIEELRIPVSEDETAVRQIRSPKSRKFSNLSKSNSTGHSLIEPGTNMDRYTLRLHEDLMTYILQNHGIVARSASQHAPGNPKKGFFWGDTDGSSRGTRDNMEGSSRGKRDNMEGSSRGKRHTIEESSRGKRGNNQRQERRLFSMNPPFLSLSRRWESVAGISSNARLEK